MTNEPTPKEAAAMRFLSQYQGTHGYPPTLVEIGKGVGWSRSVVHHHMARLQDNGYVVWNPLASRTMRLTEKGKQFLKENP